MLSEDMIRAVRHEVLIEANRRMHEQADRASRGGPGPTEEEQHEHDVDAASIAAFTAVLEDGDTFRLDWQFLDVIQ